MMRWAAFGASAVLFGLVALLYPGSTSGYDAPPIQLPWPPGTLHNINYGATYNCPPTHNGVDQYAIDFKLDIYQPVSAAAAGMVTSASYYGGYGNRVVVSHGRGYVSVYAHLASFAVGYNDQVRQGQVIGYADATGYTIPPGSHHLHFAMQHNGTAFMPEPMSGVSGFGGYGDCQATKVSPSWVSRWPLGRDATNDGCPDVFARESGGILRRYEGNCAGGLSNYFTVGPGWYSSYMSPIMGPTLINSSSTPSSACADLMARELSGGYRLLTFPGNCSGYYATSSYTAQGSGWVPWALDVLMTAGDMTGDGCPDVMAREAAPPNVMRLYPGIKSGGTCTGLLTNAQGMGSGWNLNLLAAVGDVTGDGCFDVVGAENYSPYQLRIYPGDCAGGLNPPYVFGSGWHPSVIGPILGPGDMNGDGCGDLLAREMGGGQTLWFYAGHCNATFSDGVGIGSGWSPTALPDLIPR